jgi:ArsR family transcriptional regulator
MPKQLTNVEPEAGSMLIRRAAMFKALGEPTRLRIYDFLRSCCCPVAVEDSGDVRRVDGPTVGEVCCRVTGADRINSTISEHLKELREAGLITIERRGRNMVCGVSQEAADALAEYLTDTPTMEFGICCE